MPNPFTCQQNRTEVPARREAHHLDLQGWPCLNLFHVWIWDLTQNLQGVVTLADSEYVE